MIIEGKGSDIKRIKEKFNKLLEKDKKILPKKAIEQANEGFDVLQDLIDNELKTMVQKIYKLQKKHGTAFSHSNILPNIISNLIINLAPITDDKSAHRASSIIGHALEMVAMESTCRKEILEAMEGLKDGLDKENQELEKNMKPDYVG